MPLIAIVKSLFSIKKRFRDGGELNFDRGTAEDDDRHAGRGDHLIATVAILAIAVLPLGLKLPIWVTLWCVGLWTYALSSVRKGWPIPGRTARMALVVIGLAAALILSGGLRMGGSAFIAILVMMAGIKPLEIRNHRDRMVTLFLVYFIVITSLFTIENLAITIYMLFAVLAATAGLLLFNSTGLRFGDVLRRSAILMVQAAPLVVILFVVFPRFEGGVLKLANSRTGQTGFGDTIRPGSIANLTRNDSTAFRAEFASRLPPPRDLYWRGLVLWEYDAGAWKKGFNRIRRRHAKTDKHSIYEYTIMLEAHRMPYLFSLELPLSAPHMARLTQDHTIVTRWPVRRNLRYRLRSNSEMTAQAAGDDVYRATRLPEAGNPRSRLLARQWVAAGLTTEAVVKRALDFFRQNEFVYTLSPSFLGENEIDTFLFETRAGYCEHYASAFAFLMRAAGIPSRVIAGYLGGERNPYGNYLIVKQFNAHAWAEVLVPPNRWTRVDPTLVVAPERISGGLPGSLRPEELPSFLSTSAPGAIGRFWQKAGMIYDIINLRWDAWFMDFSRLDQIALWKRLAGLFATLGGFLLLGLVSLAVGLLLIYLGANGFTAGKRPRPDRVQRTYTRFCNKLAKAGLPRKPSQGPVDYRRHIVGLRWDLRPAVDEIIECYIRLRYQQGDDKRLEKRLIRMVRHFHVS